VVPTWNYVTVHVHGELVVHDDPDWVESMVRGLTAKHEGRRAHSWSVDDAPAQYIQGQLRAIVGLELLVSRIEAKYKLNQNRSADDVRGVVTGLADAGRVQFAEQTERASAAKLSGESAELPS
jgi:transcriptional regulator